MELENIVANTVLLKAREGKRQDCYLCDLLAWIFLVIKIRDLGKVHDDKTETSVCSVIRTVNVSEAHSPLTAGKLVPHCGFSLQSYRTEKLQFSSWCRGSSAQRV
ncbi:hypothetical protein CB1_001907025 [Camelus ferus]|nr:hypothetical protein CB1_001907025 [Camelus ferus]